MSSTRDAKHKTLTDDLWYLNNFNDRRKLEIDAVCCYERKDGCRTRIMDSLEEAMERNATVIEIVTPTKKELESTLVLMARFRSYKK